MKTKKVKVKEIRRSNREIFSAMQNMEENEKHES